MKKLGLLLHIILVATFAQAQLTVILGSLPANTPSGASIYMAGNMNNWSAGAAAYKFALNASNQWQLVITPAAGALEFKLTRGSWATVEGNASGGFLPNRTFSYNGTPTTLVLNVQSWEDLGTGGGGSNSTAAANVTIIDEDFYIPQLNRYRRVWVYVPPDYTTATAKNYPVLYMLDAQNVFDTETSFAGEWQVDEALNTAFAAGDYGCIVVGVDNGGAYRLDEYSPWVNTQYGGGEGEQYLNFMVSTLKPYIDANYRTFSDRNHTGIMGSSMGGLFSHYALIERQDLYSKAGIFSSAFWFADDASVQLVQSVGKQADVRAYFLAGGGEPAYVAQDMYAVRNAMIAAGFANNTEMTTYVPTDGTHSEWFWRREFPAAYTWLFANNTSTSTGQVTSFQTLECFPNPANDLLKISFPTAGTDGFVAKIHSADGKLQLQSRIQSGDTINISGLNPGFYFVTTTYQNHYYSNKLYIIR